MCDEEILALYREGEHERAFNELVKSYSERLYWHIRTFVPSHEDADDLLQDVFMKVWTSLPSFRGESRLFTWVYRIATNETLNSLRKRRLRNVISLASEDRSFVESLESDPFFDGDAVQKRLVIAIRRLPGKQRLVFVMRYFEELDYKEISEILQTSVGSLKASYHHACMKIRNEMSLHF